jgi:transmembrane sensor
MFGVDQFVTGTSEMSTVHLRDGSVVRLAPRTRLTVTGPANQREVALDGRAYFAVAKDKGGRPFRIHTSAAEVNVLGTRFDLKAEGDDLQLVVIEGRVALFTPGSDRVVAGGEMTRVAGGNALPVTKVPDAARLVNWVGNFLAFQDTPLREVAAEIERRFGTRIRIPDPALGDRTITAWFADRTVAEVLRIVCAAALAECVTDGDTVRIVSPTN